MFRAETQARERNCPLTLITANMMKSALLWGLAILLSYQANCGPVLNKEAEGSFYSSYVANNGSLQDELRSTLLTGIFGEASNNRTILKSYTSGTSKICIPITFSITCTDQMACTPNETDHGCSSGFNSTFVWTKFNSSRLSGKVLLYFASMDATMPIMPGFEWSEACDLDYTYSTDTNNYTLSTESVPVLNVTVISLPCTSANGADLFDALQYLTTLVSPKYSQEFYPYYKNYFSIYYEKKNTAATRRRKKCMFQKDKQMI